MNKLTITHNGTTVTIEQDSPIDKDIIVGALEAMDKQQASPMPYIPYVPYNPYPWHIDPFRPYWISGETGSLGTSTYVFNPDTPSTFTLTQ